MTAVRLTCGVKGCNRTLRVIDEAEVPAAGDGAWDDPDRGLWVEACRRHGGIPYTATLDQVQAERSARGGGEVDRSKLLHFIRFSELRGDFAWAATRRSVTVHPVMPRQR